MRKGFRVECLFLGFIGLYRMYTEYTAFRAYGVLGLGFRAPSANHESQGNQATPCCPQRKPKIKILKTEAA